MRHHRLLNALASLVVGAAATAASAEDQQRVAAPAGARLVLETAAQGVQIYTCEKAGDLYRWTFIAPDAALFDETGRQIGTHFAGPSWQLLDTSKVIGEMVAQAPAPEPHAIAWLLLRAKSHDGNGVLTNAEFVRRTETLGGAAPATGCDAAKMGTQARMRYTAHYLFYTAPQ
jgi:hypothetical protein